MSDLALLIFIIIGKVSIYIVQKFPLVRDAKNKFLRELFDCSLCLGVWVYFIYALLFRVALFKSVFYFPVVSELATGAIISFIVYVFSVGWTELFSIIKVG